VKGRQSSSQHNLRNSSVSEELNTGQPAIHTEDQKLSTAPIIQDSSGGPAADLHNLIIYIYFMASPLQGYKNNIKNFGALVGVAQIDKSLKH